MRTLQADTPRVRQEDLQDDRSLGELLGDLATHSQGLMKGEILMLKHEVRDSVKSHTQAVAMGAAAGVLAFIALIFAGHFITRVLDGAMPLWTAYLITTLLYVAAAAACAWKAREAFQKKPLFPTETIEATQEDLKWIQTHK